MEWLDNEQASRSLREYLAASDKENATGALRKYISLTDPKVRWTAVTGEWFFLADATDCLIDIEPNSILEVAPTLVYRMRHLLPRMGYVYCIYLRGRPSY